MPQSSRLTPRKGTPYALYRGLCELLVGPQKISPPPGFESRTVQAVEIRCMAHAIQANAVFGTISNENMADGRTYEVGATWH